MGKGINGSYINLEGEGLFSSVQCYFDKNYINELYNLKRNQIITLLGRYKGFVMNVIIQNAKIYLDEYDSDETNKSNVKSDGFYEESEIEKVTSVTGYIYNDVEGNSVFIMPSLKAKNLHDIYIYPVETYKGVAVDHINNFR